MIHVEHLQKRYGDHHAVQDLSFDVAPGELYALLGGNGAGKTTTLHMVLGLVASDGGAIQVDGQSVGPGARPRAVYVPEVVQLYADLDAIETLELFASVAGKSVTTSACGTALEQAGLAREHHRRRIGVYSKGMRQKVALALAEVQQAGALVLDEPTSGLDAVAAAQLAERLEAAKARGSAVLMSTHDVLHVAGLADKIGILHGGVLVAELPGQGLDGPQLLQAYREAVAGLASPSHSGAQAHP